MLNNNRRMITLFERKSKIGLSITRKSMYRARFSIIFLFSMRISSDRWARQKKNQDSPNHIIIIIIIDKQRENDITARKAPSLKWWHKHTR